MTNLNQNYIAISINQFPCKDNNFTDNVEAELSSSDCKSKTFGIATGNDKSNFKNLLEEANKDTLENIQNMTAIPPTTGEITLKKQIIHRQMTGIFRHLTQNLKQTINLQPKPIITD